MTLQKKHTSLKKNTTKPAGGPKAIANPISTSGAGTDFERRVQACRLLALCLGKSIPLKVEGRVVELRFQARVHGHHTDDLVCAIEDPTGARCLMLHQMKRSLTATPSNEAFADAVGAAWFDFQSAGSFCRGVDFIVIVYDIASVSVMKGAETVAEWARHCTTAAEFLNKVATNGFSNDAHRRALTAIRNVIDGAAARPVTDGETFEFVRHLHFLGEDLDRDGTPGHMAQLEAIINAAAQAGQSVVANQVWSAMLSACAEFNKNAATVTLENVGTVLGGTLNFIFAVARSQRQAASAGLGLPPVRPAPAPATVTGLAGALDMLWAVREQLQRDALDPAPAGRADSLNTLVTRQLDRVHGRLKALRYADALEELEGFGADQAEFDIHQQARWRLMRGACRWHLEGEDAAAEDFLAAADICEDDDKLAAARVRGLLFKGETAGAVAAGQVAMARFPDSLTLWLAWASARVVAGEALELSDIPTAHNGETEALQTIAWSQVRRGRLEEATELALRAAAAPDASFFTRNLALTTVLQKVAGGSTFRATYRLFSKEDRLDLATVVELFVPRGQKLWSVQCPDTRNAAVHNLAVAHLLLEDCDETLTVISESRSNGLAIASLAQVELEALQAAGRPGKALTLGQAALEQLTAEGLATFAHIAAEVGNVAAVEAATAAAQRLDLRDARLDTVLVALRLEALRKAAPAHALAQVEGQTFSFTTPLPELVVAGRILLEGNSVKAGSTVDLVVDRLGEMKDEAELFMAAQLLMFAKRWAEAAQAYESILPVGGQSSLHIDLMFCCLRAGYRVRAREVLEAFPAGWETNDRARHLAMELGQQAGDWDLLARLAPPEVAANPTASASWLFRLTVAHRKSLADFEAVLTELPDGLTGSIPELTQLAALELQRGHAGRGLHRLYEMRRNHPDNIEAASALVITIAAAPEELPELAETLESVVPGSTVELTTEEGQTLIVTIDPTGMPGLPNSGEFIRPESDVARRLLGAHVGQAIVVADAFGGQRTHTVVSIRPALRHLLDLAHRAHHTSLVPSRHATLFTVAKDAKGNLDISQLEAQMRRSRKLIDAAFENYRAQPLTLGMLAGQVGKNVLDIVHGWGTRMPPLRVAVGAPQEQELVVAPPSAMPAICVVDAAGLAELAFAEGLDALKIFDAVFVATATRDLIDARVLEAESTRACGVSFLHDDHLAFQKITEEARAREVAYWQGFAGTVLTLCQVAPAYGRRDVETDASWVQWVVSTEEHAALLLATEKRATFLCADLSLRAIAQQNFGLQVASPQAFLAAARRRGVLTPRAYSLATLRWLLANRTFIGVSAVEVTLMVRQGTPWLRQGMAVLGELLANPTTTFDSGAQVSLDFLRTLAQRSCQVGPYTHLLEYLSEALHRHPKCPTAFTQELTTFIEDVFRTSRPLIRNLLRKAIEAGVARAKKAKGEQILEDIQVLMCCSPPMLAYMPKASVPAQEAADSALVATTLPVNVVENSADDSATLTQETAPEMP